MPSVPTLPFLPVTTSKEEAERPRPIAVLPVGSLEQHGDFLPLTTDTIVATAISSRVAHGYGLRLMPPITFSCSHEHAAWPGTVSLRAATLISVVSDIADSLRTSGIDKLVLVNGHGGNYVLSNIVQEANAAHPRSMTLFPGRADWADARTDARMRTNATEDMHGGELEVSVLLHVDPGLLRDGYQHADHEATERPHLLTLGMSGYTSSGIIGSPSLATAEKGAAVLDSLEKRFAAHLKVLTA